MNFKPKLDKRLTIRLTDSELKALTKYAKQNEFNLALSKKYIDGYQAALKMADEKGIKVNPENKKWVDFWKQYKKDHGLATSYGLIKRP